MSDITIVIPVAEYHKDLAKNAIASVQAQTIPCEIITIEDKHGLGAGWARNQGLAQADSKYISFLDADDTIAPQFAESCLASIQPNHYVYTDWYVDDKAVSAPDPCTLWTKKTFHIVTTLMRVEDVKRIGGYDEMLSGAEDTDFGLRLRLSGICGIHLPFPLFNWGDGGQRSKELRSSGKEATVLAYFTERYGGLVMADCGDCGNHPTFPQAPTNEPQPGDVLAKTLWGGNRPTLGIGSGRMYPRSGNGKFLWVDPRDIERMPHLFEVVKEQAIRPNGHILQPQYQPRNDWQNVVSAWQGGAQAVPPAQPSSPIEYKPLVNTHSQADILSKVKK